jgi:transketolase
VRAAFVETLTALAEHNAGIMLLTGDLGFGVLNRFAERFPRQYLNVGVAEQNLTGLATGLALEGRIVFTYSIANFPTLRCLEQIRNDVCYHEANVKIVSIGGGFSYGALGISHHATEDLAILRVLPNMTVVAPCNLWEVKEATRALVETTGPALLRIDKSAAASIVRPCEKFQLGRARQLRDGADITLVAAGGIMEEALRAADMLAKRGIQCRVLSMATIKPLDVESLVRAVDETGGIVTVEEHTVEGGLGGAVAEILLEMGCIPTCFHRIGLRAGFSSIVGTQKYLRKVYGMDASAIVAVVEQKLLSKELRLSEYAAR